MVFNTAFNNISVIS